MAENDKAKRNLFDKLLDQRIVLLSEPVMPGAAERLVGHLLYLDAQDSK